MHTEQRTNKYKLFKTLFASRMNSVDDMQIIGIAVPILNRLKASYLL